ncbi:alkylhydroperoxidase-related (seleno)protein [Parashewanella tropica]|uniref:alkylhydroperoxidase-related (seleno)protein n=1 Tax=Parashewanella tropica TaxID=2547970 RepID=UPI00105AAFB0|nr:alkylhydroperoxidase-related (seleno)protein [Parashewanella tropica]
MTLQEQSYFHNDFFPLTIDEAKLTMFNRIWNRLAQPGYWWNATEKHAIAKVIRKARPLPVYDRKRKSVSELAQTPTTDVLSPLTIDTIERIVTESGQLNTEWAMEVIENLGEGVYAELIAITILLLPIDLFCRFLDVAPMPLPTPLEGEPTRQLPENLRDNGAWIRQTQEAIDDQNLVNVSRAISILPIENGLRRDLVEAMYMEGHSFFDKIWKNKALSRPQLEILATKTSMINECFYCANGHAAILDIVAKKAGQKSDLNLLNNASIESAIPQSTLLLEVAEQINREPESAIQFHEQLNKEFGEKGLIEVLATVAIFNGLNRTSDPTGVPMEEVLLAVMGKKIDQLSLSGYQGVNYIRVPKGLERIKILLAFAWRRLWKAGQ